MENKIFSTMFLAALLVMTACQKKSDPQSDGDKPKTQNTGKANQTSGDNSLAHSADQSIAISTDGSAAQSGDTSTSRSGDTSTAHSGDLSVSKSGDTSVSKSGDLSISKSGDASIAKSGDISVSKSADVSISKSGDISVSKSADTSKAKSADKTTAAKIFDSKNLKVKPLPAVPNVAIGADLKLKNPNDNQAGQKPATFLVRVESPNHLKAIDIDTGLAYMDNKFIGSQKAEKALMERKSGIFCLTQKHENAKKGEVLTLMDLEQKELDKEKNVGLVNLTYANKEKQPFVINCIFRGDSGSFEALRRSFARVLTFSDSQGKWIEPKIQTPAK